MIRGSRTAKPIEAVAARGHKALDQAMLEALHNDQTGIIAMRIPTQAATKVCGACKATQSVHQVHCHNCGRAF